MNKKHFAYRSFWPELEAMRRFGEVGVNTITFFPGNSANSLGEPYSKYPANWLWYDNYDFEPVDQQIEDILSANPNAELICMIDLNSPLWLARQLWKTNGDSFTNLSEAIANPRWLEVMTDYLKAITNYCESKYSDRICGYALVCGYTDEWMDYSNGGAAPDKTAKYQEWCSDKGFTAPVDVPGCSARDQISFDNFLRDPEVDKESINYWKFTSDLVVDGIIHFSKTLKQLIRPELEVGIFYGYIMELIYARLVRAGHLSYERLLASPSVDYLISPGSYSDRPMGAGGGFMIPNGTMRRYGKGYMHECDQRTHCFNPNLTDAVALEFDHWNNEDEDIVGMRREMALSLINHTSLWWFDMWGGYYQSDRVYDNIKQMKNLWDQYSEDDSPSAAEVALIMDPESIFYVDDMSDDIGKLNHIPRNALNRLGAPYDIFSIRDIPEIDNFDQYKFIVFPSMFEVTQEKMNILDTHILNNNRTVLWLYAAGISDGEKISEDAMHKLCGAKYKQSDLTTVEMNNWKSVYLHDHNEVTPGLLKKLAKEAGVNLYCEAEQPVFANKRLFAVHTATGGEQKVTLPQRYEKVVEVYSGVTVACDAQEFVYDFKTPDTALFELIGGSTL